MKTTVYLGGASRYFQDQQTLKNSNLLFCVYILLEDIFSLSFNKSSTVVIISYVQGPFLVQMKRKIAQGGKQVEQSDWREKQQELLETTAQETEKGKQRQE